MHECFQEARVSLWGLCTDPYKTWSEQRRGLGILMILVALFTLALFHVHEDMNEFLTAMQ
jgi:hypothetical protein